MAVLRNRSGVRVDPASEDINVALRQHVISNNDWPFADGAARLHRWADLFNREFRLDLPVPAIAIARLRKGRNGQYRRGRNQLGLRHEIIIDEDHTRSSPTAEVLATLAHEMYHGWQEIHGRPSRGNHHNREFREKIKHIGIIVDQRGANLGYQRGPFTRLLEREAIDISSLQMPDYTMLMPRSHSTRLGSSKLKLWTCGCTKIRAAVTVAARCLRCGGLFEFADSNSPQE